MSGSAPRRRSDVDTFLEHFDDEAPSQQSMRGERRVTRNPGTDQKSRRRQQQRSAAEEGQMSTNGHSTENVRARLLAEAAKADTASEVARLVAEAEQARTEGLMAHQASMSWDAGSTEVRDTLHAVPVYERHTAATDWMADTDVSGGEQVRQQMIASAQGWYGGLHPSVLADGEEFRIQAEGMARRASGSYGVAAEDAGSTFLTMAATMRSRDVERGLVVEAAAVGDASYEGQGAADVLGQNPPTGEGYQGVPQAETDSNRAPAFQDMGGSAGGQESLQGQPGMAGETRTPSPDPYHAASRHTAADSNCDVCGKPLNPVEKAMGGPNRHTKCIPDGNRKDKTASGGEMPEFLKKKINDESDGDPDAPDPENEKKEGSVRSQALRGHVATCSNCAGWGRGMVRSASGQRIATCSPCGGFGGVALTDHGRTIIATLQHQGYSGLHQLDEIADPKDDPSQTPYPTDQAFPMEQGGWNPANGPQTDIAQAEQQIQQRNQGSPGMNSVNPRQSARSTEALAMQAAQEAYNAVYAARRPRTVWDSFTAAAAPTPPAQVGGYYDASGWLGDMGQTPPGPGQQDGGNPGPASNLGWTDPVYGQGGDQPPGPRKPFGADEANDRTNQPESWSVGQPTQADQGARGQSLPNSTAPGFPDNGGGYGNAGGNQFQNQKSSANQRQASFDADAQVKQARRFLAREGNAPQEVQQARQFLAAKAGEYGVRV